MWQLKLLWFFDEILVKNPFTSEFKLIIFKLIRFMINERFDLLFIFGKIEV